jgi:hypothetical protein
MLTLIFNDITGQPQQVYFDASLEWNGIASDNYTLQWQSKEYPIVMRKHMKYRINALVRESQATTFANIQPGEIVSVEYAGHIYQCTLESIDFSEINDTAFRQMTMSLIEIDYSRVLFEFKKKGRLVYNDNYSQDIFFEIINTKTVETKTIDGNFHLKEYNLTSEFYNFLIEFSNNAEFETLILDSNNHYTLNLYDDSDNLLLSSNDYDFTTFNIEDIVFYNFKLFKSQIIS